MRYIEDIQQIHVDLSREDGDILVVCSLLDKLCFLMVDWVCLIVRNQFSHMKIISSISGTTIIVFQRYSSKNIDSSERIFYSCLYLHRLIIRLNY